MNKLEKILKFTLGSLVFLLPWPVIYIYSETFIAGSKWELATLGFYGTEIIFWVSTVLFMLWVWQKKKHYANFKFAFSKDRIFVSSILFFILYCFLSTLWASNPDLAWQQTMHFIEAFIFFIMLYAGPLKYKEIIFLLTSGTLVQAFLGIFQFITQYTFGFKWLGLVKHVVAEPGTSIIASSSERWLRAYGAFSNPNIMGGYLSLTLILLTDFILKLKEKKLFWWLNYIIILTALFFTFSRSAWIAFLVSLIIISIPRIIQKQKQIYYLLISIIILIIPLTIIYSPLLQTRTSLVSQNEITSVADRLSANEEAWNVFKENLWLGTGPGNYTAYLYANNFDLKGWQLQPVHNVFLLALAELGVVGSFLLLFCLFSFIFMQKSLKLSKNYYLLLLIPYFLLLLFDHYLYSFYVGLMLSGLYFAAFSRAQTEVE